MTFRRHGVSIFTFLLSCLTLVATTANASVGFQQASASQVQFVTADDLKSRLSKGEPVTVIDVRGSSSLLENDNKITGAVYVKLRRLKSRLSLPPLKDVPRDREIVTYCACPNDESSVRAAQVLLESGFKRVRVLRGGWTAWKKANGPVEPLAKVI